MKRVKKRMRGFILFCFFLVAIIVLIEVLDKPTKHIIHDNIDAFKGVKKYEPMIQKDLSKKHLQEYTPVVLALMQQESHGKGGDPMQASESAGLAPNAIKEPKKSIDEGIKHFEHILSYGKKRHVDFPTILQAYNMGVGYIDYVAKHGGHHSEKLAKNFSLQQVNQKPNLYNCGGDKNNFRYPYCYGDFSYSDKVKENVKSLTHSVPAYLSSSAKVY
ncbi:putative membrane protein YocA [Pullulanibacillus camelliae]|uniref:Putative membrane protein YocA n=1 Tax=Pullulanibacillus camelliae TaxID=1707096 RepID=A0A8J2VNK3_9BACL|nr:lysozyme family protein [Pullulanibacillus camelliae]GGE33952.1 putative membrane protein YocA [Pullulanibacillus camelliae]